MIFYWSNIPYSNNLNAPQSNFNHRKNDVKVMKAKAEQKISKSMYLEIIIFNNAFIYSIKLFIWYHKPWIYFFPSNNTQISFCIHLNSRWLNKYRNYDLDTTKIPSNIATHRIFFSPTLRCYWNIKTFHVSVLFFRYFHLISINAEWIFPPSFLVNRSISHREDVVCNVEQKK